MEDKYVVALAGIVGAVLLGIANLILKGPDATVTTTIVGAITFCAGVAFGIKKSQG